MKLTAILLCLLCLCFIGCGNDSSDKAAPSNAAASNTARISGAQAIELAKKSLPAGKWQNTLAHKNSWWSNSENKFHGHNNDIEFGFKLTCFINEKPLLRDYKEILLEYLTLNPNAKLKDLCQYVTQKAGFTPRLSVMSRTVRKLQLPYKKKGNQGRTPKSRAIPLLPSITT